jgi:pimeloyl-ACP methyl ester carboxylesterase
VFDPFLIINSIVLCHGLTGNRDQTFTHSNGKFWPKDFLHKDFPDATIVTFGYDADVVRLRTMASSDRVRDHGKSLVQSLKALRSGPDSTSFGALPIILIAHSLGGLVAEQAYILTLTRPDLQDLRHSIRGIIFMGTPHYGSSLARWGSLLSRLTNVIRRSNGDIIRDLAPQAEALQAVEEEFMTAITNNPNSVQLHCFYEADAMPLVGKVVEQDSAIIRGYPNCSINGNHMSMTKFESPHDAGYVHVRSVLQEWYSALYRESASFSDETQAAAGAPDVQPTRGSVQMNFNGKTEAQKVIQGVEFSGSGGITM